MLFPVTEGGYKIRNQSATHFLTFTVVSWIDIFTRKVYRDMLLDSFKHCQQHKGLLLHAWCVMSNHAHIIATATNADLSAVIRDLKTFTSKSIVKAIENNPAESRKEWMLDLFKGQGNDNSRNKGHQFWKQNNHPEELYSPAFIFQKLNYIHNNPVEAGIVDQPWEYLYSSARDYHTGKKCGLIDISFL
ncbi:MAG: transposase [Chitinophagaceae bacterium]